MCLLFDLFSFCFFLKETPEIRLKIEYKDDEKRKQYFKLSNDVSTLQQRLANTDLLNQIKSQKFSPFYNIAKVKSLLYY